MTKFKREWRYRMIAENVREAKNAARFISGCDAVSVEHALTAQAAITRARMGAAYFNKRRNKLLGAVSVANRAIQAQFSKLVRKCGR